MKLIAVVLLSLLISGCTKVNGWTAVEWRDESLMWFEKHEQLETRYWSVVECVEGKVAILAPETVDEFKFSLSECY